MKRMCSKIIAVSEMKCVQNSIQIGPPVIKETGYIQTCIHTV